MTVRILVAASAIAFLFGPTAASAQSTPAPAPAVVPTPPSDAVVTGWARQWLQYMEIGQIADRSQLNAQMNAQLTDDVVRSVQSQMNSLGEPIAVELARKITSNGYVGYYFRIRFDNGDWTEHMDLDSNYKIAMLRFYPGNP